jgi:hypothetical protein
VFSTSTSESAAAIDQEQAHEDQNQKVQICVAALFGSCLLEQSRTAELGHCRRLWIR